MQCTLYKRNSTHFPTNLPGTGLSLEEIVLLLPPRAERNPFTSHQDHDHAPRGAGGGDEGVCYIYLLKASACYACAPALASGRAAGQQGAIDAFSLKPNPSFAAVEAAGRRGRPRRCAAAVPVVAVARSVGGPGSRRRMSCV